MSQPVAASPAYVAPAASSDQFAYRPLSEEQKALVARVKATEADFQKLADELKGVADPRCVATAKTQLQQARFWLVEAITSPPPAAKAT